MNILVDRLKDVEFVAEQILSHKQQILNYDIQRQKNREALNSMKSQQDDDKMWLSFGNMFIKTKVSQAKSVIKKDQSNIDENINDLRDELKKKLTELRKLEGKPELKGFNLKALDRNELRSLKQIVPEVVNF